MARRVSRAAQSTTRRDAAAAVPRATASWVASRSLKAADAAPMPPGPGGCRSRSRSHGPASRRRSSHAARRRTEPAPRSARPRPRPDRLAAPPIKPTASAYGQAHGAHGPDAGSPTIKPTDPAPTGRRRGCDMPARRRVPRQPGIPKTASSRRPGHWTRVAGALTPPRPATAAPPTLNDRPRRLTAVRARPGGRESTCAPLAARAEAAKRTSRATKRTRTRPPADRHARENPSRTERGKL